jgi:hypothetical protein
MRQTLKKVSRAKPAYRRQAAKSQSKDKNTLILFVANIRFFTSKQRN